MVRITAETPKEFERLDGLSKKLFSSVMIVGTSVKVEEGILDQINIFPEKGGEITRVYSLDKPDAYKVIFWDFQSDYLILEVEGQKYNIHYKSE